MSLANSLPIEREQENYYESPNNIIRLPLTNDSDHMSTATVEEITAYISELSSYHITLDSLIKNRPTQLSTVKQVREVAQAIYENKTWMEKLQKHKKLNCSMLAMELGLQRKWIAKYFELIVSMVIIKGGQYQQLAQWVEGGV